MSAIDSSLCEKTQTFTIRLSGRLDYSLRDAFIDTYRSLDTKPEHFVVDLNAVDHMDSTGLGMLLLLRDFSSDEENRSSKQVSIIGSNPTVKALLKNVNFDQLFNID